MSSYQSESPLISLSKSSEKDSQIKDTSPKSNFSKKLSNLKKHLNWSPSKVNNPVNTINDQTHFSDNPNNPKLELMDALLSVINPTKDPNSSNPTQEKIVLRRPLFLQLTNDQYAEAVNNIVRPIIESSSLLPLMSGYAEAVNAGKTRFLNEDQATITQLTMTIDKSNNNKDTNSFVKTKVPYFYFGVYDGHAGPAPAIMASNRLHLIIEEKFNGIGALFLEDFMQTPYECLKHNPELKPFFFPESLLVGAIQSCFYAMDKEIYDTLALNGIGGGTTAVVAMIILGRLVVAHAGDSQAGIFRNGKIIMLTDPHTVDSDRKRCQLIASLRPDFLMNRITPLQYCRDLNKSDIGKEVMYRDYNMDGWNKKIVTEHDIRPSLISSDGHSFRLMEVISTTRGFGDHLLSFEADDSTRVAIKPFMSNEPFVNIFNYLENDILILGTDGFWEYVSHSQIEAEIESVLNENNDDNDKKYNTIASRLVKLARGEPDIELLWADKKNRTRSSFDDITVIVVPLNGIGVSDLLLPPRKLSESSIKLQKRHGSVLNASKQSYLESFVEQNSSSFEQKTNETSNDNWDHNNTAL